MSYVAITRPNHMPSTPTTLPTPTSIPFYLPALHQSSSPALPSHLVVVPSSCQANLGMFCNVRLLWQISQFFANFENFANLAQILRDFASKFGSFAKFAFFVDFGNLGHFCKFGHFCKNLGIFDNFGLFWKMFGNFWQIWKFRTLG